MDARTNPPTACTLSDVDGDGYGSDPTCIEPDCDETNPSIHPASFEACNGLDDDCDGIADESLGAQICGLGACTVETDNCIDGEVVACEPGPPNEEICNGIDDDCDGVIDESLVSMPCGLGQCARTVSCTDGVMPECIPGAPAEEVCNNLDDDCDGVVDNGFRTRIIFSTYTELARHHPDCNADIERIGPACNAAMNRFCQAQECGSTGFGPAENSGDVAHVTCISGTRPQRVEFNLLWLQHEACDGPEDAMSGPCAAAVHRYCQDQGARTGFGPIELQADTMLVTCLTEAVDVLHTTYDAVSQEHSPCDGTRERIGPNCNAAIKRWCRGQGYESGFGPLENSGSNLVVACLRR